MMLFFKKKQDKTINGTVGYGDIYPVTNLGRIIAMFSSFVGIAIVALPAGILTAGYMEELNNKEKRIDLY